jgi:hypothetical protein
LQNISEINIENNSNQLPSHLKYLFWDTDFESLRLDSNIEEIVTRIIMYGDDKSYKFLFKNIDVSTIKNILNNEREIDDITRNYWNLVFAKQ